MSKINNEILKQLIKNSYEKEVNSLKERKEKLLDEIALLRFKADKKGKKDLVKELDKLIEELRRS